MSTQFFIFHKCLVLLTALLTMLVGASTGVQAYTNRNIPPPIPVSISSADLDSTLNSVRNSLFFLSPSLPGKVDVEFDSFLLPNGAYANTTFIWKSLVSTKGGNIVLRKPTAKELGNENLFFGSNPAIYFTDTKVQPAYATGTATMRIPTSFAHVTFAANEANQSRSDGPITVTLQSCSGNAVSLQIKCKFKEHDFFVILSDAAGRPLTINASSGSGFDNELSADYKANGAIANIDIFTPAQFITRIFDVLVMSEPKIPFSAESISVKAPRYIPRGPVLAEATFDLAALKAQTSIGARRDYTMLDFNTPMVVVKLPHALNSAYANLDFGEPKILDAKAITYALEEGGFNFDSFSNEFHFMEVKGPFAYADGTMHINYPAKLRLVTLTPAKPSDGAVHARFHGGLVRININEYGMDDFFLPANLATVRAFDANGRQLKKLNLYGSSPISVNGVAWSPYGFWGNIAKLQVVVVDEWLPLDLPYHLPPAPEIPKDQMGIIPANED